jgi:hypothetical protein
VISWQVEREQAQIAHRAIHPAIEGGVRRLQVAGPGVLTGGRHGRDRFGLGQRRAGNRYGIGRASHHTCHLGVGTRRQPQIDPGHGCIEVVRPGCEFDHRAPDDSI